MKKHETSGSVGGSDWEIEDQSTEGGQDLERQKQKQ